MLFTVHSSPLAAILFSQLANITSMANMPSTNDTKNMSLEILLALNIVRSKDNKIAWKHSQNLISSINSLLAKHRILV